MTVTVEMLECSGQDDAPHIDYKVCRCDEVMSTFISKLDTICTFCRSDFHHVLNARTWTKRPGRVGKIWSTLCVVQGSVSGHFNRI